jgi:hypothetical protein
VVAAAALALTAGCAALDLLPPAIPAGAPAGGTALEALEALPVKGRAPRTGYEREAFGAGWVDVDGNGCDTRNDVLARDLSGTTAVPGTRGCVVASGTLVDPYSAATITFVRGEGTSDDVQVDHVVALSDAWQKGARALTREQRTAFANDPLNLLAVDGPLNAAKGDADAATWLPPAAGYRCAYVARQVAVKARHGLWVTPAERDAIARVLARCPGEPLPAGAGDPGAGEPDVRAAPAPERAPGPYRDCAAVRAAGAAPISTGDPGWSAALDGDGDGVGCEG